MGWEPEQVPNQAYPNVARNASTFVGVRASVESSTVNQAGTAMQPVAGSRGHPSILDRIVESKRAEVQRLESRTDVLAAAARDAMPPRDFEAALRRRGQVALIAEIKRRSPGAGEICGLLDPAAQAASYEAGGAVLRRTAARSSKLPEK